MAEGSRRMTKTRRISATALVVGIVAVAFMLSVKRANTDDSPGWVYDPSTERGWSGIWRNAERRKLSVETIFDNVSEALRKVEENERLFDENYEEWKHHQDAEVERILDELDKTMEESSSSHRWTTATVIGETRRGAAQMLPNTLRTRVARRYSQYGVQAPDNSGVRLGTVVLETMEIELPSGRTTQHHTETLTGAVIGLDGNARYIFEMAGLY